MPPGSASQAVTRMPIPQVAQKLNSFAGARLRLAARIAPGPPDNALAGFQQALELRQEAHRPDKGEGPQVRVGKGLVQPCRRGKQRAPFRDHIVDEEDPVGPVRRLIFRNKGIVVLLHRGPLAAERGGGFANGEPTAQAYQHRACQADLLESDCESLGGPGNARRRCAARDRDED